MPPTFVGVRVGTGVGGVGDCVGGLVGVGVGSGTDGELGVLGVDGVEGEEGEEGVLVVPLHSASVFVGAKTCRG